MVVYKETMASSLSMKSVKRGGWLDSPYEALYTPDQP